MIVTHNCHPFDILYIDWNDQTCVFGSMIIGSLISFFIWLITSFLNNKNDWCSCDMPPLDIKDPYYDVPLRVYGGAKVKHRIILIRHGESLHNKKHDWKDGVSMPKQPELDTNLSCEGYEQAKEIGRYLASFNWHPDIIRVSPMARAIQTSSPFLSKLLTKESQELINKPSENTITNITTVNGLSSQYKLDVQCIEVNIWEDQPLKTGCHITKKETYLEFVSRIKKWKQSLEDECLELFPQKRIQTIVFTHSMVISELLNLIVSENRTNVSNDYWSKIYWQVNNGSITCLDLMDNKEWHVHTVNYTKHIKTHTGLKSPFV